MHKMNIRKLKTNLKKAIRFRIKMTTRNVPTREDAMLKNPFLKMLRFKMKKMNVRLKLNHSLLSVLYI